MKKNALVSILAILLACCVVMGCASALADSQKQRTLTVFNWFDYIDEDVIKMFEQETGIKVTYTNFTTNEEMFVKLEKSAGSYDVIFPSDYIIERMIKEDMLEELDMSKIPNAANLIDWCKSPDYDPEGKYSVAYMWGTVGILYDPDQVDGEIDSWGALIDPQYKYGVFMLDSIRDSFGVCLRYLGYSLNDHSEEALDAVKDLLIQQKNDNIVAGYLVDETKDKMVAGEAAMAVMWSGDAMYAIEENENLRYVIPKEGSNIWIDGMCVLKNSQHKDEAMEFINFLCRPDIAAMNQEYISYCSPIQQVVDGYDEEQLNQPALNPSAETMENCEFFHDITEFMELYESRWMEVRA